MSSCQNVALRFEECCLMWMFGLFSLKCTVRFGFCLCCESIFYKTCLIDIFFGTISGELILQLICFNVGLPWFLGSCPICFPGMLLDQHVVLLTGLFVLVLSPTSFAFPVFQPFSQNTEIGLTGTLRPHLKTFWFSCFVLCLVFASLAALFCFFCVATSHVVGRFSWFGVSSGRVFWPPRDTFGAFVVVFTSPAFSPVSCFVFLSGRVYDLTPFSFKGGR